MLLSLFYTSSAPLVHSAASTASIPRRATGLYLPAKSYWGSAPKCPQHLNGPKELTGLPNLLLLLHTHITEFSTSLGAPPVLSHLIPVTGLLPVLVPQIQNTLIPIPSLALIQAQICLGSAWHTTAFLSPVLTTW